MSPEEHMPVGFASLEDYQIRDEQIDKLVERGYWILSYHMRVGMILHIGRLQRPCPGGICVPNLHTGGLPGYC